MNTTQNKKLTLTGQTAEHVIDGRINRRRLGIILGGAIAVCLAGASPPVVASDTSRRAPAASVDQSGGGGVGRREWFDRLVAGQLGRESPGCAAAVDESGIAAWADANGSTGSSPASLRPIGD